jgi:iron complex outermembrane recepter protein
MESRKFQFITAAILALSLTRAASGEPQPSAALVEFHIASQPLAHALNAWAQQCGLQLIWPADGEVARVQSRSLYGKYQPMQALALLLQDSGLQYSVLKEGTVTLGERTADSSTVVSVKATSEQP